MENRLGKGKRVGRPRLSETKSRTVGIRLSESERFIVQTKAKSVGLRITTYIRQVIIDGQVKPRLTEDERGYVRHLVGFSNNINQVARACHDQGIIKAMGYFETFRSQIDQILKKLAR